MALVLMGAAYQDINKSEVYNPKLCIKTWIIETLKILGRETSKMCFNICQGSNGSTAGIIKLF